MADGLTSENLPQRPPREAGGGGGGGEEGVRPGLWVCHIPSLVRGLGSGGCRAMADV